MNDASQFKHHLATIVSVAVLVGSVVLIERFAPSTLRFSILPFAVLCGSAATYALYRLNSLRASHVLVLAVVLRALLIPVQPVFSDDAYRYLWDGQLVSSGINPYSETPEALRERPEVANFRFDKLNSPNYYSVYPPVSQIVFALSVVVGQGDWGRSYLALKFLLILLELVGVSLLLRFATRTSTLLYALNPVVVFEVAGQAHSEAIAIPFILATIVYAARKRAFPSGVTLAFATLVKLSPALLLLALARHFQRRSWWLITGFVAAAVGLSIPFTSAEVIPNALSSLNLYVRLFEFNSGPYLAMKEFLRFLTGLDLSKQLGPLLAISAISAIVFVSFRPSRLPYHSSRDHGPPNEAGLAMWIVTIFGITIALATTVHPWYFLPLLSVVALSQRPHWHWQWLAACSSGTYLLYSDGPYLWFVIIGWGGAAFIFVATQRNELLRWILRRRAKTKADVVASLEPDINCARSVLDLGCGEGYVGDEIHKRSGATIQLADVRNCNLTSHPFRLVNGRTLPFENDAFDHTILYFVLHHARDQEAVVSEAIRCSRQSVIVVESTFRSEMGHKVLRMLDLLANRMRAGKSMRQQENDLCFRSPNDWERFAHSNGFRIRASRQWGSPLHRQVGFVIDASAFIASRE